MQTAVFSLASRQSNLTQAVKIPVRHVIVLILLAFTMTTQGQTIVNPGFNDPVVSRSFNTTGIVEGWSTAGGGTVIRWNPGRRLGNFLISDSGDGSTVLALPNLRSQIQQDIAGTVVNQTYQVTFDYSVVVSENSANDWVYDLSANIDGVQALNLLGNRSDLDSPLGGPDFPSVRKARFVFSATDTTTNLQFISNVDSVRSSDIPGIWIDNVTLSAIPESSSSFLLWIGVALVLGRVSHQRKQVL